MAEFGALFDAAWYAARNPDVAAQGADPLRHYLEHGMAEGRDPNPLFATGWYLEHGLHAAASRMKDEIRAAGAEQRLAELTSALGEALRQRDEARCERERLLASASWRLTYPMRSAAALLPASLRTQLRRAIKAAWWVATPWQTRERLRRRRGQNTRLAYVAVADPAPTEPQAQAAPDEASLSPLAHYLTIGAAQGRDPHPLFDTDWYLSRNPDVAEAGINPLAHFLTIGAVQGRAPHPSFELDWSRPANVESQVILPTPSRAARVQRPLVSVVVPVFDKAPYLRDCLDSILGQSLEDIEVICIDDASTDTSPQILEDLARYPIRACSSCETARIAAPADRETPESTWRGENSYNSPTPMTSFPRTRCESSTTSQRPTGCPSRAAASRSSARRLTPPTSARATTPIKSAPKGTVRASTTSRTFGCRGGT